MPKYIKEKEKFDFRSEKINIMGYSTFESLLYLVNSPSPIYWLE